MSDDSPLEREERVLVFISIITLGHCYFVKKDYGIAMSCYSKVLSAQLATDSEKDISMKWLKEIEKRRKGAGIGSFFFKN